MSEQFLIESGVATHAQLPHAYEMQLRVTPSLGEIARGLGLLADEQLLQVFNFQRGRGAASAQLEYAWVLDRGSGRANPGPTAAGTVGTLLTAV